nr:hypothetical protein [uncultured Allomuricauda sp.]
MKKDLGNLIASIQTIENIDIKAQEINQLLEEIESYQLEKYQEYYIKGSLWNLHPFDSEQRKLEVESNLKKSLSLREDYIFSKTELSFFYFDEKRYQNVVKLLDNVDFSFFEKNGQLWKSLKLEELYLVSKLYLAKQISNNLLNDFLGLISSYLILPDEELAIPEELVLGIIENKGKAGMSKLITNTQTLINSKIHKDYFSDKIKKSFSEMI